jgi:phosphoglycolate phosphatase
MTLTFAAHPPRALPARPGTVIFDLDGTLTDPKPGITRSVQDAMIRLGRPAPSADDLEWVIGPPLRQSFVRLLGSEAEADRGVALYRERYGTVGLFENEVIAGIPALVDRLRADGRRLFVATSKVRVFAQRILEHFGLATPFERIYGSELDGTNADKRDLLRAVFAAETLDPADAVIIGDREHDVLGGAAVGMAAIGVRWGYGSDEELLGAGVAAIADTPEDLGTLLGLPFQGPASR